MIYLHKLLPLLLSPIVIVLLCILYGTYRNRKAFVLLGLTILYLASTPIISERLFLLIENQAPRQNPEKLVKADAIIVLSGMVSTITTHQGLVSEWSDPDRFFGGIQLYKLGRADRLIFTGGLMPWENHNITEGVVLRQFAETMGVPSSSISVTEAVQNTEQESLAARKLFTNPRPTILLVTSAFHMPRAKPLFERAGFIVQAYPVDYRVHPNKTTPMDFMPNARFLDLTSIATREFLGQFYYRIQHLLITSFQSI